MKAKIALATVSGKAYYKLVNELKAKGLHFLSLTPWDSIPLDVKVVITTEEEGPSIAHPYVLKLKNGDDPVRVIDEAIRIVQGKQRYEKIIVGVDPGKTFGVAVVGDGVVLKTINCSSLREAIDAILEAVQKAPAAEYVVKVGDGAPPYTRVLLEALDKSLPQAIDTQIVSEAGTSHFAKETSHLRGLKDAMSAIKIAARNGQAFKRKRTT
jgi:hypothetical protein